MIEIKSSLPKRVDLSGEGLVCYCFGYTRKEIENDFKENGRSLIYEKIGVEKRAGGCNCAAKNPSGK